MRRSIACFAIVLWIASTSILAAPWNMQTGTPSLKSAGSLAFGPEGVLFVGDAKAATVFAIDTGDKGGNPNEVELHVHGLGAKVAEAVGSNEVAINDMAVNPETGAAFLAVHFGSDPQAGIVKVLPNGEVELLSLKQINFSRVVLSDAPKDEAQGEGRRRRNPRDESITDLAFSDNRVLVSGLSNSSSPSTVREIMFPFEEADKGVSIEIYHGAHGRYEDNRAVKTFVPFKIDGKPHLLAGFQCTPLVKFPIEKLQDKPAKVQGTTIAELGNRNRPLDMIVYEQGGKDYVLMSNNPRGVMKISTDNIERSDGITERVAGGGTAGQVYDTIESLKGVEQMDRLNDGHILVIAKSADGLDLHTVDLP